MRFKTDSTGSVLATPVGSGVVLLPKARSWEILVESLAKFPADFMETRGQPHDIDRREPLQ